MLQESVRSATLLLVTILLLSLASVSSYKLKQISARRNHSRMYSSFFGFGGTKVTAENTPCPKLPAPEVSNTADLCLG